MPSVTRIGDMDMFHCSLPHRFECSPDVNVNGFGVSRETDNNDPHQKPAGLICVPHTAPIAKGSKSVYANKLGVGRIGDPVNGLLNPCTQVAEGSQDVFAGD